MNQKFTKYARYLFLEGMNLFNTEAYILNKKSLCKILVKLKLKFVRKALKIILYLKIYIIIKIIII